MTPFYGEDSCNYCGHDCGIFRINNPRDIGDGIRVWDIMEPFSCPGCGNPRTEFHEHYIEILASKNMGVEMPVFYPARNSFL